MAACGDPFFGNFGGHWNMDCIPEVTVAPTRTKCRTFSEPEMPEIQIRQEVNVDKKVDIFINKDEKQ